MAAHSVSILLVPATIIAIYGAVLSTLLAARTVMIDRVRVRLDAIRSRRYTRTDTKDPVAQASGPPTVKLFVTNIGRRKVRLVGIGYRYRRRLTRPWRAPMEPVIAIAPPFPVDLVEGETMEIGDPAFTGIIQRTTRLVRVFVQDSLGGKHAISRKRLREIQTGKDPLPEGVPPTAGPLIESARRK